MGLEEDVVIAAVLLYDPFHIGRLLLFARGGTVARADDDEVFLRRQVEQPREAGVVEFGHAVELLFRSLGKGRQQLVGLDALHLHCSQPVGDERAGGFHQAAVLQHQPVIGARREVVGPGVGGELLRRAGLGIAAAVVPVEGFDFGGVVVPVLLGRGGIAEVVVEIVVGRRAVGEHRHLHACRVDALRHEPVVAQAAPQVVDP